MTDQERLRKIIIEHAELIEGKMFSELYKEVSTKYKKSDAVWIISALRELGMNIPVEDVPVLFGIATKNYTLELRARIKGSNKHNTNFTSNQGRRGGHQIGFLTIAEAEEFIRKIDYAGYAHVSTMQENSIRRFTWVTIETPHGECLTTTLALSHFA